MLALGLNFLGHHDTEYGHIPLLAAPGAGSLAGILGHRGRRNFLSRSWSTEWTALRLGGSTRPGVACPAGGARGGRHSVEPPVSRHRSGDGPDRPVPVRRGAGRRRRAAGPLVPRAHARDGPVHRTARSQDVSALVAAEPGVQSGRQPLPRGRSGRLVRAISGSCRFPRHRAEFVRSYVGDRHGFEARYQAQSDAERAALALRQGASYVVAAAPAATRRIRPAVGRPPPARAAARRGALRRLPRQARGARPAPAVAEPMGERCRLDRGQDLHPRGLPAGLGQGECTLADRRSELEPAWARLPPSR